MVIDRHDYHAEQIVRRLKQAATMRLTQENLHPLREHAAADGKLPSPWARKCWKVYLDSVDDVRRGITYVEQNPLKEGKRAQHWPFGIPHV